MEVQDNGANSEKVLAMPMDGMQPALANFAACNEGIANGFGAMFFNIRDPAFTQTNHPAKRDASKHIPLAAGTVILIAGVAVGVAGVHSFLTVAGSVILIVISYIIYLACGCAFSELREYISNLKHLDDYQQTFSKMAQGRGYFKFSIECYHYETVWRSKRTERRKVVTHRAEELFQPAACCDESGKIESIFDTKNFIFVHYLKRFYFTDDASQGRFVAAFNAFVSRNSRDSFQTYDHQFEIEGYEEFTAFTMLGDAPKSQAKYFLCTLLGLALPYACFFERDVARYDVGLLKRVSL